MTGQRTADVERGGSSGPGGRRDAVRRRVLTEGSARIDDLAKAFDVSVMTMHRDLDALQSEGWLTKIRGAATANSSALLEATVRARSSAMRAEKAALAVAAGRMLAVGQTLFLDDSTTVMAMVPGIVERAPVTVATNFLPIVRELQDVSGVELHVLGGTYHRLQEGCFGLQTVDAIGRLRADVFFMSTTAVTHGACFHRSEATIATRLAFMASAARSVLLVDHAKFGRQAAHRLCALDRFDTVVVDSGIDPEDLDELRSTCREVVVADVGDVPPA